MSDLQKRASHHGLCLANTKLHSYCHVKGAGTGVRGGGGEGGGHAVPPAGAAPQNTGPTAFG